MAKVGLAFGQERQFTRDELSLYLVRKVQQNLRPPSL